MMSGWPSIVVSVWNPVRPAMTRYETVLSKGGFVLYHVSVQLGGPFGSVTFLVVTPCSDIE